MWRAKQSLTLDFILWINDLVGDGVINQSLRQLTLIDMNAIVVLTKHFDIFIQTRIIFILGKWICHMYIFT